MSDQSVEVIIIDDDEPMRDSLALLFSSVGLKTRLYKDATDFLAHPPPTCLGCIVTDVRMPGISGLKLIEKLNDTGIILPVIFITGFADVTMAVKAMKLGAVDFLEKPVNQQALIERVQSAIDKSARITATCCRARDARTLLSLLTEREYKIAELVAQGLRSKDIARTLAISAKTVEVHRHNVLNKLNADNPVEILNVFNAAQAMTHTCQTPKRHVGTMAMAPKPRSE